MAPAPAPAPASPSVPIVGALGAAAILVVGLVLFISLAHGSSAPAGQGTQGSQGSASTGPTAPGSRPAPVAGPDSTIFPPLPETLPPELRATPADPGVLIDQRTADTVASVLVPLHMDSLWRHDLAGISRLEADDALLVDLHGGSFEAPAPTSVQYTGLVDGLEQTQYPVSFVDEVHWIDQDGYDVIDLLVITRADAASTWKVSLEAPFRWSNGGTVLTSNGHLPFQSQLEPVSSATAQTYPAAMAAYWQSWADHGGPPADTPFANAGALTDTGETIAAARRDMKARGETRVTRYVPGPRSYAFAVDAEHTLLCSSVHWESTTTPTAGRTISQPADQSAYGRGLSPGEYLSVHSLGLRQTCFITASRGPGVLGQAGGVFDISGVVAA